MARPSPRLLREMDNDLLVTDLLTRVGGIDAKLDTLLERTAAHAPQIEAHERRLEDHSGRIRDLERDKWKLVGGAAAISGLVAVLGAAIPLAIH